MYTKDLLIKTKRENQIYDLWVFIFTFVIIGCVVWSLRNIALATHDDVKMFVDVQSLSFKDYMENTFSFMIKRARISIIQMVAYGINYFVLSSKSQFLYVMLMYIPIIINVFYFGNIVGKYFGKYIGFSIPVVFFVFVQIDLYHNLMVSYPLNFQVGFFVFLISLQLFLRYYKNKKNWMIVLSAIFMFDSFSAYESFVTYFIIFLLIALCNNLSLSESNKQFNIKQFIKDIKFHTIAVFLYLFIYYICSKFGNFGYDGSTIDTYNFSIKLALKTILTFGTSLFPLREFFSNGIFHQFTSSTISFRYIVKAVAAAFAFILIFTRSEKLQFKKIIIPIAIAIISCFIFNIPHALTSKYQYWVSIGIKGFVPSYFDFYWIILTLCLLGVYIVNINKKTKPFLIILGCMLIFAGSVFTDYSNESTIRSKTADTISYKMFDRLVETDYYANLEDDAVIYTTDYSGIHNVISTLGEYGALYSGKDYYYTNDINDAMQFEHKYYLSYDADNQCIYLSRMSGNGLVDSVYIMTYSDSETTNTFYAYKTSSINPLYVNNTYYADFESTIKIPLTDSVNGVLIQTQNMVLDSYKLTNENSITTTELTEFSFGETYQLNQSLPFIQFISGWSSQENWGRWSEGYESQIMLLMPDTQNNDLQVVMNVKTVKQMDGLNVEICCNNQVLYDGRVNETGAIVFTLPDALVKNYGIVYLDIYCNNAVSPKDIGLSIDDRILGIGVEDVTINLSKNID